MINKLLLLSLLGSTGSIGYIKYSHYVKNKDLHFVHQQLCENHPGFYNEQDPEFRVVLQQGYDDAQSKISKLYWWQNHIVILQEYLKRFHDSHLRIYKENVALLTDVNSYSRRFFVESLKDHAVVIHIPTFMPNKEQQQQFEKMIQTLSALTDIKNIIFDLRGNSGGNSELGTQILKALFGNDFVDQQLYELYKNQTVWWRASRDNSNYLYELISYFSQNAELNKGLLSWLIEIAQGVKRSLMNEEIFFIEKESNYKKPMRKTLCSIHQKMIVVIDETNVSAALDFITELKALSNDIIFIGHKTDADTMYMEVRTVILPSKYGTLQFPIKMYQHRPRANNQKYSPDIVCPTKNIDDLWILDISQKIIENFS